MEKKYYDIGMIAFNELAKMQPSFKGNFSSIDEFFSRAAKQHANIVQKNGYSPSLDLIYMKEISKFYEAVTGISSDFLEEMFRQFYAEFRFEITNGNSPDTPYTKERVILYPTFNHELGINGITAHVPTSESFIIDKRSIIFQSSNMKDYIPMAFTNFDNAEEAMTAILSLISYAAEYWADEGKLNDSERELLKNKMITDFSINNAALYKDNFFK